MALIACRECGKQISTEAKACPNCGAGASIQKPKKSGMGTITKVFLGLFALVVLGNLISPGKRTSAPTLSATPAAATATPTPAPATATPSPSPTTPAPTTITDAPSAAQSANASTINSAPSGSVSARGNDEHCFDIGAAIASVYIANFRKMAEVNLMASEVMTEGCQARAGMEGSDCVRRCEIGFKVEARKAGK